jgi:hypothetical protein
MSLSPNSLPSNPVHCGTTAERCLFLVESPLLFSLTHPARAGQQLEWTCDRTSEPPQVLTASLVYSLLSGSLQVFYAAGMMLIYMISSPTEATRMEITATREFLRCECGLKGGARRVHVE